VSAVTIGYFESEQCLKYNGGNPNQRASIILYFVGFHSCTEAHGTPRSRQVNIHFHDLYSRPSLETATSPSPTRQKPTLPQRASKDPNLRVRWYSLATPTLAAAYTTIDSSSNFLSCKHKHRLNYTPIPPQPKLTTHNV
jgi:hypothetical protein